VGGAIGIVGGDPEVCATIAAEALAAL